jgi:hypothetical protein
LGVKNKKDLRMNVSLILVRTVLLSCCLLGLDGSFAAAQSVAAPEKTRNNLMVVVRESIGGNKQDEALKPMGKAKAKLPDGREIELEMNSWEFIGDTHIRFVFDGPQTMIGATPDDFTHLKIADVDQALALALANVKRVYGEPSATQWTGGVMQVQGKSPDLDSTYFLDREYWRSLLKKNPEGLIVAVPKRGGLLFAPVSDSKAIDGLKRGIAKLYSSSGRLRVSSTLYLFKDDKWSVYQAAVKQ